VNYYKLDAVRRVLEGEYGAARKSFSARPCVEVWTRIDQGHTYRAALAWENREWVLTEEEIVAVAEALELAPGKVLVSIQRQGGLYLGPSPPGSE